MPYFQAAECPLVVLRWHSSCIWRAVGHCSDPACVLRPCCQSMICCNLKRRALRVYENTRLTYDAPTHTTKGRTALRRCVLECFSAEHVYALDAHLKVGSIGLLNSILRGRVSREAIFDAACKRAIEHRGVVCCSNRVPELHTRRCTPLSVSRFGTHHSCCACNS